MNRLNKTESAIFISLFWICCPRGSDFYQISYTDHDKIITVSKQYLYQRALFYDIAFLKMFLGNAKRNLNPCYDHISFIIREFIKCALNFLFIIYLKRK